MICPNCGASVSSIEIHCPSCRYPLQQDEYGDGFQRPEERTYVYLEEQMIRSLRKRLIVPGVLCLINGILLLLGTLAAAAGGLFSLFMLRSDILYSILMQAEPELPSEVTGLLLQYPYMIGLALLAAALLMGVCGLVSVIFAGRTLSFRSRLLRSPKEITMRYDCIGGAVVFLIFNILCCGTLGIIGAIFNITAHGYVRNHAAEFRAMERGKHPFARISQFNDFPME